MTDFRALCAELADWIHEETRTSSGISDPLVARARAALAQPEPQGPTDEELDELAEEYLDWNADGIRGYARAVLARWGRPAIEPVPVSERLPGPEDCDAEGRCWIGSSPTHEADNFNSSWELSPFTHGDTHWLPHWALPVPGVEGEP